MPCPKFAKRGDAILIVRQVGFYFLVKIRAVVFDPNMGKLVNNDGIDRFLRQQHHSAGKTETVLWAAATPPSGRRSNFYAGWRNAH